MSQVISIHHYQSFTSNWWLLTHIHGTEFGHPNTFKCPKKNRPSREKDRWILQTFHTTLMSSDMRVIYIKNTTAIHWLFAMDKGYRYLYNMFAWKLFVGYPWGFKLMAVNTYTWNRIWPLGSCRPHVGPMLVPWTLLSGNTFKCPGINGVISFQQAHRWLKHYFKIYLVIGDSVYPTTWFNVADEISSVLVAL